MSLKKKSPRILIFSPSGHGGIAEHTFYQGNALVAKGAEVTALVPPGFLNGRVSAFQKVSCLPASVPAGGNALVRKLKMAWGILASEWMLAWQVIRCRPDLVLLDSYAEYLSPLWIDPHLILARVFGVCYAANLHDPVRNHVVGPLWWHRLSVWLAYQPLNFVLVHHRLPEPSPVPDRVRVIEAPHGLYDVDCGFHDRRQIRRDLGITELQKAFLSFGFIRDGKNLDLVIRALADVPEAILIVAGSVASSHDKPVAFYRELAQKVGVLERCRFFEGFVSDEEMGKYFSVTDFVLLTYSAAFRSQSGVLNLAAKARKPVLASASPSPLMETVRKFDLGIAIAPDRQEEVTCGMRRLICGEVHPQWEAYEDAASWTANAERVLHEAERTITR